LKRSFPGVYIPDKTVIAAANEYLLDEQLVRTHSALRTDSNGAGTRADNAFPYFFVRVQRSIDYSPLIHLVSRQKLTFAKFTLEKRVYQSDPVGPPSEGAVHNKPIECGALDWFDKNFINAVPKSRKPSVTATGRPASIRGWHANLSVPLKEGNRAEVRQRIDKGGLAQLGEMETDYSAVWTDEQGKKHVLIVIEFKVASQKQRGHQARPSMLLRSLTFACVPCVCVVHSNSLTTTLKASLSCACMVRSLST
jgi:hypothetical protein